PYNISLHTQETAQKAMEKLAEKEVMVKEIIEQRDIMADNLMKIAAVEKVYPSDANFLLVKVDNARALYGFLLEKKIIVRDRSKVNLCEECLRITIGTAEENRLLLGALKAYTFERSH